MSAWQREALQELSGLGRKTLTEHEARRFLAHWQVTGSERSARRLSRQHWLRRGSSAIQWCLKWNRRIFRIKPRLVWSAWGAERGRAAPGLCRDHAQCRAPCPQCSGARGAGPGNGPWGIETIVGLSQILCSDQSCSSAWEGYSPNSTRMALRACPISQSDAREMLQEVKGARLLEGFRGHPPPMWTRWSTCWCVCHSSGCSANARSRAGPNPLLVLPRGQGVRAADALIVLA